MNLIAKSIQKLKQNGSSLFFSTLITINDAQIIDLIKKNNLDLLSIENQTNQFELNFEKADLNYKPFLNLDFNKEIDNTDTLLSPVKQDANKTKLTAVLGKNFKTGTQILLENIYYKSDSNQNLTTPDYFQNNLNLNIQQQVFPDFFGEQETKKWQAAEFQLKKGILQSRLEEIEFIKLRLSDFWKLSGLNAQIENNRSLMSKYQQLEKKIRQKSANNMSAAGELEQTLAEVITRKQSIEEDTLLYNQLIQKLKEDLQIETQTELKLSSLSTKNKKIDFQINENFDLKKTLKYNLQKFKAETTEAEMLATESNNWPDIKLYGRYGIQGIDQNSQASFDEYKNADKNKYSIGLKINYSFGSNINEIQNRLTKKAYDIEKTKMNRIDDDLNIFYKNLALKLKITKSSIENNQKIYELRKSITKKINQNYLQGRSDFLQLLDANNKEFNAETNLLNTYGQFQIQKFEYDQLTSPIF